METLNQIAARIARRYQPATLARHWDKVVDAAAKRVVGPVPSQEIKHTPYGL